MEKNFDLREVPIEDVFEAISKDPTADVNILFHENAAKALRDLADDAVRGARLAGSGTASDQELRHHRR